MPIRPHPPFNDSMENMPSNLVILAIPDDRKPPMHPPQLE